MILNSEEYQKLMLITTGLKNARRLNLVLMESVGELESALAKDSESGSNTSEKRCFWLVSQEQPKMAKVVTMAADILNKLVKTSGDIAESAYVDCKDGSHLAGLETDHAGSLKISTTLRNGLSGINPDGVGGDVSANSESQETVKPYTLEAAIEMANNVVQAMNEVVSKQTEPTEVNSINRNSILALAEQNTNIVHVLGVALDEMDILKPETEMTEQQYTELGRKTATHYTGTHLVLLYALDMLVNLQQRIRYIAETGDSRND